MDVPGSGPVVRGGREAGQLEARIDTLTRWAAAAAATSWAVVLQKVPSEVNPKVRNHGEGPY